MPKTIETISYIRVGNVEHPIDAVTINGRQIPSASELLPNISLSDNGKILRVLNGQWSLFSPGSLYDEINGIDCGNEPTFAEQYLTFEILTNGTIGWKSYDDTCQKTISYSINDGAWTEITATSAGVTIPVTVGDKVRFKGVNSNYALSNTSYSGFGNVGTSTYNVYGNIMSLIYGDNFKDQLTLTNDYALCCLFDGGNVVSAENLVLPAMSLTKHCYRAMFANCSYITTAPTELPATTIAESCYRFMFSADPLLTSIPSILPATTMQKECYYGMFNGCSSISAAPELPAPTLTTSCYKQMFLNCSNLNYIKCLATDISVGSPTTSWVSGVAATGTFVKAVDMSSWTINSVNGIPTGWTVIDNVIITVSDPEISFANNIITISCDTENAVIYYRLGTTGSFQVYSSPIEISENTHVETYASLSGTDSNTVTYDCTYVPDEGDSDSDYGDSDSESEGTGYESEYLTFDVKSDGDITWKYFNGSPKTISYSKNDSEWTTITATLSGSSISVITGDKIRFKGTNNSYGISDGYHKFGGSSSFDVYGNIMSLIGGDDFTNITTLPSDDIFKNLFCSSNVISAKNLILSATTLTLRCYQWMFKNCTSLTTAPVISATTLASYCCYQMFYGCTSLTSISSLPATTLAENCYYEMFRGCTSLTSIPSLPATTLASDCYRSMFMNCSLLTSIPSLPATTLTQGCYSAMFYGCTSLTSIPSLPATTLASSCYSHMFRNCTSLISAPSTLPATTLTNNCYLSMFNGCTSLTTAPILPATSLAENCYSNMFYGCTNLNYIKCLATDISATNCTTSWVDGVAATGTFVKDKDMVSWTIGTDGIPTGWTVVDYDLYAEEYLTFDVKSDGNITWKMGSSSATAKTISYSKNGGAWTDITSTTSGVSIPVVAGDKLKFKGNSSTYSTDLSYEFANSFGGTATIDVYGNIMSLIGGDNFSNLTALSSSYTFAHLFRDCTGLLSAENLILPATTLKDYCYTSMFRGCTSLTTAPELPATTLKDYCYGHMFQGCTSLTTAPELPATTLVNDCYGHMFQGCTSLTTTPELPATTLNDYCYTSMFRGCTSLTTAPELPVTTLKDYCYSQMFLGCTGLTSAPELPATTLKSYCYSNMFLGCTGLTSAPELPATTLKDYCYSQMFYGCTNLNYIKCLATNISASYCTNSWVSGVAASGTFVKEDSMTDWTINSIDGIPVGWTLINVSDESTSEDSDWGDSDSDYGDSESEEPVITVSDPVISIANNTLTITCDTTGATIYYKLGESGTYQEYTTPVALGADTTVYAYASLNGVDSEIVSEEFVHNYSLDYLTFNVLTGGNILWKSIGSGQAKTISYSKNDGEWTSITATSGGTAIPVSAGDVVRFKGTNSTYAKDKSNYSGFDGGTATYNVEGNMMSLIYGDDFVGNNTLSGTYNFCSIFKQSKAVSAENMILPATTLTNYCYRAMFSLAPNLIAPPALPATTLAQGCYWYMFESCPMSTAPDLPAPTLVQECYGNMFINCSNLNYIKCLATTKSATNCLQSWVKNVAATGTFVKDANTTWSTGVNGIPTGWVVYDGEIIEDPVINFNGENKIEISCETSGATIYYRLGTSGSYTEYTGLIIITEDVTVYAYAEKDGQQSQTVSQECVYSEHIYKFGDLVFASGPLYYGNDGYEIKDSWNYSSYGTAYGKTVGSTFFNFIEMGDLFKKSGFSESDGSILNTLDPLDGWRLPTKDEWDYIVGSTRPGSTVNGTSGKHYAFIDFDHDNNQNTGSISGLLIFPDNETITGATLSYFDSVSTNVITLEQFNNYLSQGCVFLQANGLYQTTTGFLNGGLNYWSSSDYSESTVPAYALRKYSEISTSLYNKEDCYLPVYLVKDTTYGEETPLEGATKSLNTWTI